MIWFIRKTIGVSEEAAVVVIIWLALIAVLAIIGTIVWLALKSSNDRRERRNLFRNPPKWL